MLMTLIALSLTQVPRADAGVLVPPLLPTVTYAPTPAPFSTSCDVAPNGTWRGDYGCHAIEWVGLKRGVSFVSSANMCFGVDVFTHAPNPACLEGNEASSAVFPRGNPSGTWQSAKASTPHELLAGAVLAMKRYGSPVYATVSMAGVLKNVAFERIRVTSPLPLDTRCAWLGWATAASLDEVDHKCAVFELRTLGNVSVDLVSWDATVGRVDATYTGDELASLWAAGVESLEPSADRVPKYEYVFNVP